MKKYSELTKDELKNLKSELEKECEELKKLNLNLDMSRGKPCKEQLDLSMDLLSVLDKNSNLICEDGMDCRNYGGLTGIKEARELLATFMENKDFILELAKKHPEFNWIFRPHFALKDRLLKYNVMKHDEIDKYWAEWENIGIISKSTDNYYEQFMLSDCLITDCMSFLSEYLPTGNPI